MVFIHGGGFVEGTGILEWGIGPHFFMEYGVIMVAINYRVGPFGKFLTFIFSHIRLTTML